MSNHPPLQARAGSLASLSISYQSTSLCYILCFGIWWTIVCLPPVCALPGSLFLSCMALHSSRLLATKFPSVFFSWEEHFHKSGDMPDYLSIITLVLSVLTSHCWATPTFSFLKLAYVITYLLLSLLPRMQAAEKQNHGCAGKRCAVRMWQEQRREYVPWEPCNWKAMGFKKKKKQRNEWWIMRTEYFL